MDDFKGEGDGNDMSVHIMKTATFDKADTALWREAATNTLKGKPFETLVTKTLEGIDLHPLYTLEDLESRAQKHRGIGNKAGWIVTQQTFAQDGQQFIEKVKDSLKRGNEAILYDGTQQLDWDQSSLEELAQLMVSYPFFIRNTAKQDPVLNAFSLIPEVMRPTVKGTIFVPNWNIPDGFSQVRTIGADSWHAHHKGADAVTELALTLVQAAQYAEVNENFSDFANDFFVHFAVDTHFFMEIAKFRAFRILWQAFGTAYGMMETPNIQILATTSLRSYSKLDPYVNLLRAGNEAFSAVLGGADVITVHPHDVLTGPTDASIRFARNLQLVIKEETHVDKVLDPSGGSYFIETITSELVENAWALFIEIEADGGYEAFMNSSRLDDLLKQRRSDVAKGKKSLIGTNVYADLTATELTNGDAALTEGRLAEPFEKIRSKFEEGQPRTILVTFGSLKDFKPRADFVGGFLAIGGIRSEWSPAFQEVQDAIDWLQQERPDYAIVCASPTETESIIPQLLGKLPDSVILEAAGKYDTELAQQWLDLGLHGFLFVGQDKVEKLFDIYSQWKGGGQGE
jgi:methylmalonyl-CoA mutase